MSLWALKDLSNHPIPWMIEKFDVWSEILPLLYLKKARKPLKSVPNLIGTLELCSAYGEPFLDERCAAFL